MQDDISTSSSLVVSTNGDSLAPSGAGSKVDTPHVKKRHRRMKSSGLKKDGDADGELQTWIIDFITFTSTCQLIKRYVTIW